MTRIAGSIQARMSSTRLPGKGGEKQRSEQILQQMQRWEDGERGRERTIDNIEALLPPSQLRRSLAKAGQIGEIAFVERAHVERRYGCHGLLCGMDRLAQCSEEWTGLRLKLL